MHPVFFYQICRTLNKPLSQIAICCRLVELIMGSVAALMTIVIVVIANSSVLEQALSLSKFACSFGLSQVSTYQLMSIRGYSWGLREPSHFPYSTNNVTYQALAAWGIITYTSFIAYPVAKSSLQAFQRSDVCDYPRHNV